MSGIEHIRPKKGELGREWIFLVLSLILAFLVWVLINLSKDTFIVNDGERIAQMVIARHETAEFIEVETLNETERGEGGYGHTGVK